MSVHHHREDLMKKEPAAKQESGLWAVFLKLFEVLIQPFFSEILISTDKLSFRVPTEIWPGVVSLAPNPRAHCSYDSWDSREGIFPLFNYRENNQLGPGEIIECTSWLCLVLIQLWHEVKQPRKHQNPQMPRGAISRGVRKVTQRFSSLYQHVNKPDTILEH